MLRGDYVYIGEPLYVYGIVQTSTSELVYVGQSRDPYARLISHKSQYTAEDIRDDCHLILFDDGYDLTYADEHFWIEYMSWLGFNLRNKRIRHATSAYPRHVTDGYVLPHLAQDISKMGITISQLAWLAGLTFRETISIVNGGRTTRSLAEKICRVLKYGVAELKLLSHRRRCNLIDGTTSYANVKAYQKRLEKKQL